MNERDITRTIQALDNEKFHLPYEWLKAQGRNHWGQSDMLEAEKATADRRREILDELRKLRAERKAAIAARRVERESNARAKRERNDAERAAVTKECQICEHQQCVTRDGRMVHHGYLRPGHGSIEGDCFGVGRLPYPETDALCEYLASCRAYATHARASIAGLPGRTEIIERDWRTKDFVTYKKAETSELEWSRKLQSIRWKLESDLRWFESEVERCMTRIAAAESATVCRDIVRAE